MNDFMIPLVAAAALFPLFARIFLPHTKLGIYLQKLDDEPNGHLDADLEYLKNSVDLALIAMFLSVAIGELIANPHLNDMSYRQVEYVVVTFLWISYMLFWQMRIRLLLEKCRAAEIQALVSLGKIGFSYYQFFLLASFVFYLFWNIGLKGASLAFLIASILQFLLFVRWMFRPRAV